MKTTSFLKGMLAAAFVAGGVGVTALPAAQTNASKPLRNIIYYDEWHHQNINIPPDLATAITHVVIAFAPTTLFTSTSPGTFTPFVPLATVRAQFPSAQLGLAIGGWGDTAGLSLGCLTPESRALFASNVAATATLHGFDFIDLDWEYPGGNGADYRQVPNAEKIAEIAAFPQLLAAIRAAIAPRALSVAVPGRPGDMLAWTVTTAPEIMASVDWVNVMAYDLCNRRDALSAHHTDVAGSLAAVDRYLALGADPAKLNLGFAFYAKYFQTLPGTDCSRVPVGCALRTAELPDGSDAGTSGAVTFEPSSFADASEVGQSMRLALQNGRTDEPAGGEYWWDSQRGVFWTFETPALVGRKFDEIVAARGLGGVFAWSLGEDTYDWRLVRAIHEGVVRMGY